MAVPRTRPPRQGDPDAAAAAPAGPGRRPDRPPGERAAGPPPGPDGRLVAAVAAGDVAAVRACLAEGAAPDTPGADGLPVLCTAVAGFDHPSAGALVEAGADPDRTLPDGTTPLLRAVELGSPALVDAVLGRDPGRRLDAGSRQRLLDLARHWYETGAAEVLRLRTGATGPDVRRRTDDDGSTVVEELRLGGLTVRAGHGAVLTTLEREFGVLAPVAELVARAVPHPDDEHVDWFTAGCTAARRRSAQAWSDLAGLRHHPDPAHRRFLACVLWQRDLWAGGRDDRADAVRDVELLAAWALDEPDGRVLAKVLEAYAGKEPHPGQESAGLRHAGHPDPRVRREVPNCLSRYGVPRSEAATAALVTLAGDADPRVRAGVARVFAAPRELNRTARETLLLLVGDRDPGVRACAAAALADADDRTAAVMDALTALLDGEDQALRLEAAYALALRDDPRTEQAYARVGPLGPGLEHDPRVSARGGYLRRNRPAPA